MARFDLGGGTLNLRYLGMIVAMLERDGCVEVVNGKPDEGGTAATLLEGIAEFIEKK